MKYNIIIIVCIGLILYLVISMLVICMRLFILLLFAYALLMA